MRMSHSWYRDHPLFTFKSMISLRPNTVIDQWLQLMRSIFSYWSISRPKGEGKRELSVNWWRSLTIILPWYRGCCLEPQPVMTHGSFPSCVAFAARRPDVHVNKCVIAGVSVGWDPDNQIDAQTGSISTTINLAGTWRNSHRDTHEEVVFKKKMHPLKFSLSITTGINPPCLYRS